MKKKFLIIILFLAVVFLTGCIRVNRKDSNTAAGVYKSFDKGANWQAKQRLVLPEGGGSIRTVNVLNLLFDPQDNGAIYLLSQSDGMIYTYDGGENWFQPLELSSEGVTDIGIDPINKCTIYVTYTNKVLKSADCNRSWREVYLDTRPKALTAVGIDSKNSATVYVGNVNGEMLKSSNGGESWTTIKKFGSEIEKIIADPTRGGTFYVATAAAGIYKTVDGGGNWTDLNGGLKQYKGYNTYYNLVMNTSNPENLFLISNYGIIKTTDGGTTWEALKLITPPSGARIYAFAVNPVNSDELYYATATTFYKTVNGGENWSTKRLPTSAAAGYLLVDPKNPNILYLGLRNLK